MLRGGIAALTGKLAGGMVYMMAENTEPTVTDVVDSAQQVTEDTVQEVNHVIHYIQSHIPDLVAFGIQVLLAIAFFVIGGKVIKWIRKIVKRSMERANADTGVAQFVDSMLKFVLYALLIFSIATKFGVESSSVAALIASAGVAIGLALQGSLSNFAGGILILLLKPFSVGDYIVVNSGGIEGTVSEIQIFYTKMNTVDNKAIVVPNSILTGNSLTNVTASTQRQLDLRVGIAYDADLKKAKAVAQSVLEKDESVLKEKDRTIFVDELADSSVVLGIRAWVKTEDYWAAKWRIQEEVKLAFDAEGVEIPFNQLTVHMKNQ